MLQWIKTGGSVTLSSCHLLRCGAWHIRNAKVVGSIPTSDHVVCEMSSVFASILIVVCSLALFGAELNEVIIDRPEPTHLNKEEEEILLFYLEHLGPHSREFYFRIASFYIQIDDLQEAKKSLYLALDVDPDYLEGVTQLGFLHLWEGELEQADQRFTEAWGLDPCDRSAVMGWLRLALHLTRESRSIEIAKQVELCELNDPDALLYLGILDTRLGRWEEAEKALKQSLKQSPKYQDTWLQLAHLYVLEGKYENAEEIYRDHPKAVESDKGLANIAVRKGDYREAESYYQKALEQKPDDIEARRGLAQVLATQQKYSEAKRQYAILLKERAFKSGKIPIVLPRDDEENWIHSMDVKSHTNFAFKEELDYTDAKEDDPSLRVPVVKDYYFTQKFTLFIPVFDRWRLEAQQLYYHQRENDILPPVGVNYSAFVNGGALYSHYFFARDWKWDVILKGVKATGIQNANFPFRSSALFEPGSILMYNSDWNLFVLDAHVEDLIIKNFALSIAQLLRIDVYQGEYGLQPPIYLHPKFGIGAGQDFYHDSIHNWKQHQKALASIDLWPNSLRVSYLFEHGKFKKLTDSYFTYKKQIQHTIGIKWTRDFFRKMQFEAMWEHIIQSNRNVILPVGTLIFVGPSLYLIGNRYTGLLRYRYHDQLRAEISGHYFMLTLPYHDWNLKGSLIWQF